ncbi:MAG: hypothetical protein M0Z66_15545 [Thermaerobacter sp.]|jgi:hypothetical protein|nr:hypothetical protein [Thermaerobacter sp.]
MAWPAGRRTKHVTVYMSAAEFEVWEAVRAAEVFTPSRADMLMEWLVPQCDELASSSRNDDKRRRCQAALDALGHEAPPADLRLYSGHVTRPPRRASQTS